jgi:hypothetical protein
MANCLPNWSAKLVVSGIKMDKPAKGSIENE